MHDAESLIDGYVTLTFLDGDMSTPTARSQKYLDKYLLDRSYEPEDVEPKARKKPEPVSRPSPPDEVKTVVSKPPEPILRERKPANTSIKLDDKKPVNLITTPAAPEKPAEKAIVKPIVKPIVQKTAPEPTRPESSILVPVAAESEEDRDQEIEPTPATRKKPDSWLRRMFNPSSWNR